MIATGFLFAFGVFLFYVVVTLVRNSLAQMSYYRQWEPQKERRTLDDLVRAHPVWSVVITVGGMFLVLATLVIVGGK